MNEILQQIILLFIFALLIGFAIGYFLRHSSYKKRYKAQIAQLEDESQKSEHFYTKALEKDDRIQYEYDQVDAKYQEQKDLYDSLQEEVEKLREEKAALIKKIHFLQHNLLQTKQEIALQKEKEKALYDDITLAKSEEPLYLERKNEEGHLHHLLVELQSKIKQYEKKIATLKEEIHTIKVKTPELEEALKSKRAQLFKVEKELAPIRKKFQKRLKTAHKEYEDLKIRLLNYEYAIKAYEEKIAASLKPSIKKFIKKTDGERVVDKILHTLSRKRDLPKKEA